MFRGVSVTEKGFTKQEVNDGINRYKINVSNFIVEILDDYIPMHYSTIVNRLNEQHKTITRLEKENEQLKQDLFEASEELLWATSDEVDRVLYYEDEVEELRKEIFND